jgi:hypothetical protein
MDLDMPGQILNDFPNGAYVYIHRKASSGAPFYVGKGTGRRAWDEKKRSALWKRTAKKHGFFVEIVQSGLQEWAAFEIETGLISMIGRLDQCLGPLVNMTDGGEGMLGHTPSNQTRAKLSSKLKGEGNPAFGLFGEKSRSYGSKRSEESKQKMSSARKSFQASNPNWRSALGPVTPEMRQKISEKKKGIKPNEETRAKLSIVQKEIWKNPCIRAARLSGIAQKGVKQDPEFAARRTAAAHAKRRENKLKLLAQLDCSNAAFCAPTKLTSLSLREEGGLGKG